MSCPRDVTGEGGREERVTREPPLAKTQVRSGSVCRRLLLCPSPLLRASGPTGPPSDRSTLHPTILLLPSPPPSTWTIPKEPHSLLPPKLTPPHLKRPKFTEKSKLHRMTMDVVSREKGV